MLRLSSARLWSFKTGGLNLNTKLLSKNFLLVVIGQIISLFGNATIRFALPLYLLNQTGSSVVYGAVTACAFIPAILLSPVGGIIADRVNKRNIMVILDFFTSAIILFFLLLMNVADLVILITMTMMVLYGIAGAYQPSVQASVPALVSRENYMAANSIVNTISSFSSLLGPVLGGIIYSAYGIEAVLAVCMICFFVSACMEVFIKMPLTKQCSNESILIRVKEDLENSVHFIQKDKTAIGKILLMICGVNMFLSSMIMVGLPYLITEAFDLAPEQANQLYGIAEGALAAGGLAGGIAAGVFSKKLLIKKAGNLIVVCAVSVFPIGIAMIMFQSGLINYIVITICCFIIMVFSTVFMVQMMSFIQEETPQLLIGKVIAVVFTVSMCAQPLGNALYGVLFDLCKGFEFAAVLFSAFVSLLIAVRARKIFHNL